MVAIRDVTSLGRRLSIRRRLPDGSVGDVVGHVVDESADRLVLLPHDRGEIEVNPADVLARREIPPRVVRPAGSAADVARLAAECWPGTEQARLGGWLLRAGGGFTRRANSCVVAGQSGVAAAEAIGAVRAWYAERGLPAIFYVVDGSEAGVAGTPLAGLRSSTVNDVLVLDLRSTAPPPPTGPAPTVTEDPSEAWLDLWRGGAARGETERAVVTAVPARYVVLSDGSGPLACARTVLTGRWVHLSCVTVREDRRGTGLGRAVTAAAVADARALEPRTQFVVLEVEVDNMPARGLYEAMGFRRHHSGRYLIDTGDATRADDGC